MDASLLPELGGDDDTGLLPEGTTVRGALADVPSTRYFCCGGTRGGTSRGKPREYRCNARICSATTRTAPWARAGPHNRVACVAWQTFVSVCRYDRVFWLLVVGLFTAFPVLLLIAALAEGGTGTAFMVITVLYLILSLAGIAFTMNRNKAAYRIAVAKGSWHEGVFVFPTGDVVVRFNQLFQKLELHIEGTALSKATVVRHFSLYRCGEAPFLQLHFVDTTGRPMLMEVCGEDLVASAESIAEHINATKRKHTGGY